MRDTDSSPASNRRALCDGMEAMNSIQRSPGGIHSRPLAALVFGDSRDTIFPERILGLSTATAFDAIGPLCPVADSIDVR